MYDGKRVRGPSRTPRFFWQATASVLAIVLVVVSLLLVVPVKTEHNTVVDPFGFTFQTSKSAGLFQPLAFCPAGGTSTNGTLWFVWRDTSGGEVDFYVTVSGATPPPNPLIFLYQVNNSTEGGDSVPFGYPLCEYSLSFTGGATEPQTVRVEGMFVYNTTTSVPLL